MAFYFISDWVMFLKWSWFVLYMHAEMIKYIFIFTAFHADASLAFYK